jgi:hypothetical protein
VVRHGDLGKPPHDDGEGACCDCQSQLGNK